MCTWVRPCVHVSMWPTLRDQSGDDSINGAFVLSVLLHWWLIKPTGVETLRSPPPLEPWLPKHPRLKPSMRPPSLAAPAHQSDFSTCGALLQLCSEWCDTAGNLIVAVVYLLRAFSVQKDGADSSGEHTINLHETQPQVNRFPGMHISKGWLKNTEPLLWISMISGIIIIGGNMPPASPLLWSDEFNNCTYLACRNVWFFHAAPEVISKRTAQSRTTVSRV